MICGTGGGGSKVHIRKERPVSRVNPAKYLIRKRNLILCVSLSLFGKGKDLWPYTHTAPSNQAASNGRKVLMMEESIIAALFPVSVPAKRL
jgi:hypothetical protein